MFSLASFTWFSYKKMYMDSNLLGQLKVATINQ